MGITSPRTARYCFCNPPKNILLQFGIYGQSKSGVQIQYVDDFRVSDYRPVR